ncbi:MAG: OmpA family protein, partial [Oceanococcaceae bacterium]
MLQGCEVGDRLLLRGVQFATDQDLILAQSTPLLEQVAAELGANPSIQVAIQGHTDAIGDAAYNQELSQRRAAAVQSFLLARGVHPEQLQARGYGESQPLMPNDTAAGRAQNRRVELQMVGTRNPVASAPPPPQKVYISTFSAYPSTLTVPVGTTVTWHNFSETSHDVTFADASL